MAKQTSETNKAALEDGNVPTCGVIMPISELAPYPATHWRDVLGIIDEAATAAGFKAKMVSDDESIGVIQQRIVQNLYDNEIVVVDVSGRNPNVMFELGMRLAFDRPAVIIKDELTPYNFDTSPIEHISYRSDLHYQSTIAFKINLSEKLRSTYEAAKDPAHSVFLKHFGEFTAQKLEKKEVSEYSVILEELASLRRDVRGRLSSGVQAGLFPAIPAGWSKNDASLPDVAFTMSRSKSVEMVMHGFTEKQVRLATGDIGARFPTASIQILAGPPPRVTLRVDATDVPGLVNYVSGKYPGVSVSY